MVIRSSNRLSYVKKVFLAAAKKADRIAAEGTTFIQVEGNEAVILRSKCRNRFRC